ncbi:MAG: DUF4116 domain-containing protein [Chlamydiia bacterium]
MTVGGVGSGGSEHDPLGAVDFNQTTSKEVQLAAHLIAKSYQQLCQSTTSSVTLKALLQAMQRTREEVGAPVPATGEGEGPTQRAADLALHILHLSAAQVAEPYRDTIESAGLAETKPLTDTEISGICDEQDLLDQVVNTSGHLLKNVSREIFGKVELQRRPLAFQQWMLLNKAHPAKPIPPVRGSLQEWLGSQGDDINQGQLSSSIAEALKDDEVLLKEPGATPEGIEAQRTVHQATWQKLQNQVRDNLPFRTPNKTLTPEERLQLYERFVQRLARLWNEYSLGGTPWSFFDLLNRFLDDCETGWEGQISQAESTVFGIEPFFMPLETVRDQRRELVRGAAVDANPERNAGVGNHYYPALNQLLNDSMALGYSEAQLGEVEPHMQAIVRPNARATAARRENLQEAEAVIQEKWLASEASRDVVLARLREIYEEALPSIPVDARLLSAEERQMVEDYQRRVKDAMTAFQKEPNSNTRKALNSLLLPAQMPTNELGSLLIDPETVPELPSLPQPGTFAASPLGEGFERCVENLSAEAESSAFVNALTFPDAGAHHKKGAITPFGLHLWMALTGAAALKNESPEMQAIVHSMQDATFADAREIEKTLIEKEPLNAEITDRETALAAVRHGGHGLRNMAPELRADREIVLTAIRHYGFALAYAAPELRADREMILTAFQTDLWALERAAPELLADRAFALDAVSTHPMALRYLDPQLVADRSFLLEALQRNGLLLEYMPPELAGDRDNVLNAVKQNGIALLYVPAGLRHDFEICAAAVRNTRSALQYVMPSMQADYRFQIATETNPWRIQLLWSLWSLSAIGRGIANFISRRGGI